MGGRCDFEPVCNGICAISMYNNVTCRFIEGVTPILNIQEMNPADVREEWYRMRKELKELSK